MIAIDEYFSISTEYSSIDDICFASNAILFYGANHEDRSLLSTDFQIIHPNVKLIFVEEFSDEKIKIIIDSQEQIISLRSSKNLRLISDSLIGRNVYINITGLTHSTWAWIVKSMLFRKDGSTYVIYLEPAEYKFNDAPLESQIFDLSEKTRSIAPLPTLAKLGQYSSDDFIFMPLLGFEGARLAYIIEDIQPSQQFTFPVLGIPGFRHEYPFYTYQGNKQILERENIWMNRRYEKANCPASIYVLGKHLLDLYPNKVLRIAPIGTKPHALGAILLKLSFPNRVDIVYDHPVGKKGRTKGKARTMCYRLNPFKEVIQS